MLRIVGSSLAPTTDPETVHPALDSALRERDGVNPFSPADQAGDLCIQYRS